MEGRPINSLKQYNGFDTRTEKNKRLKTTPNNRYLDTYTSKDKSKKKKKDSPDRKSKKKKENKRFHYKLSSFNADESINENNKQKEIIKGFESTDFSTYKKNQ